MPKTITRKHAAVAVALIALGAIGLTAAGLVLAPRPTAAQRGAESFVALGCSGCHGAGGGGAIPNPGSEETEIPGFVGGTAMMYVESVEEIRQWILDGRPARLDEPLAGNAALIQMPKYRDRISSDQLDDLVAWYQATGWYEPGIPRDAKKGRSAARNAGCFGCHGESGLVGAANPGSFKGYIPGWGSEDFFELVQDPEELRQWILDSTPRRFTEHPIASIFVERQLISMPAYRDVLTAGQIESISSYICWRAGWQCPIVAAD